MKKNLKRMAALILAVITCLSVAACKNTPKWEGKWEISNEDYTNAIFVEPHSEESDGRRTVTITGDDLKFKSEIGSDNIRVTAFPLTDEEVNTYSSEDYSDDEAATDESNAAEETTSEADASGATEDEDSESDDIAGIEDRLILVDDVKVNRISDTAIEVSFKEPEYPYACLLGYYIHKDAVESGQFAVGAEYIGQEPDPVPTATIDTKLKNGAENPTIELVLENTTASENIKPEDVTLSGVFANMTVEAVEADGESLKIKTKGEVEVTSSKYGYIDLAKTATESGRKIMALTEVEYLDAFVDSKTFAFSDGVLNFDVDVLGKELDVSNEELVKALKLEGATIEKAEIADDKNSFRLYVRTDAGTLNEAVDKLNGLSLEIGSKAVGGSGITVDFVSSSAVLTFAIESIDKPDGDSEKFKATAHLFTLSGELKELSKSDITFSGDFEGAEVTKIKKADSGVNIEFSFSADEDRTYFGGNVQLSKGKLLDMWGTESENLSAYGCYAFETSKGDSADSLSTSFSKLVNDKESIRYLTEVVTGTGKTIAGLIGHNYGDALLGLKTLAGGLGIIDHRSPEEKKLDQIKSIVQDVKNAVDNIKSDISSLSSKLSEYGDKVLDQTMKTNLESAQKTWNSFEAQYIITLDSTISSYQNDVNQEIVNYIRKNHGDELKLYYDTDGNLAIPMSDDPTHSVDAKKIDDSKTVTVKFDSSSFENCSNVFDKRGYVFCEELIPAIKADLVNAVEKMRESGDNSLEANDDTAEMIYDYISSQISLNVLLSEKNSYKKDIVSQYNELCYCISGKGTMASVLPTFYNIMSYKYNFQSEAKEDINKMRNYLISTLYRYAVFAGIADKYGNAGGTSTLEATRNAVSYIQQHSGLYPEKTGTSYCYVVGKCITIRVSGMFGNVNYKYRKIASSLPSRDILKVYYDGYDDPGVRAYTIRGIEQNTSQANSNNNNNTPPMMPGGIPLVGPWSPQVPVITGVYDYSQNQTTLMSKNILSDIELNIIKARFEVNGFSQKMSFKDYLTDGKTVRAEKNAVSEYFIEKTQKVLTHLNDEAPVPTDGSVKMKCKTGDIYTPIEYMDAQTLQMVSWTPKSDYFTNYETVNFGAKGTRINEYKDYLEVNRQYTGTVFDFSSNSVQEKYPVMQYALYGEDHSRWNVAEIAEFYGLNYGDSYIIFPIV